MDGLLALAYQQAPVKRGACGSCSVSLGSWGAAGGLCAATAPGSLEQRDRLQKGRCEDVLVPPKS